MGKDDIEKKGVPIPKESELRDSYLGPLPRSSEGPLVFCFEIDIQATGRRRHYLGLSARVQVREDLPRFLSWRLGVEKSCDCSLLLRSSVSMPLRV